MSNRLSDREHVIIENWRRQYRHRWLACGVFGTLAVVQASVATLHLLEVVRVLRERKVPFFDAVTLNWVQYLGEIDTIRLLLVLATAMLLTLLSAAIVMSLIVTFRVGFRRYRIMEKLLRADSDDATDDGG